MKKEKKICFISSSGGHFSELYQFKELSNSYNSILVVEKTEEFKTDFCNKRYYLYETNRKERTFVFKIMLNAIKELLIFIKERPNIIISTGALSSYPMIKIAKIFRKKIIYVESFARINDLSKTGKMVYKIADHFLVQWPELVEKYPKSIYVGNVFGISIK